MWALWDCQCGKLNHRTKYCEKCGGYWLTHEEDEDDDKNNGED